MSSLLSPGPPNKPLPRRLRTAALLAMVLGAWVGVFGAMEAMASAQVNRQTPPSATFFGPQTEVFEKVFRSYERALAPGRPFRVLVLFCLATACAMVTVSAARLLWPRGIPREAMRRVLSTSALAAAVCRTLEGAHSAAAARRMGVEMADLLAQNMGAPSDPAELVRYKAAVPSMFVASNVGLTLLMAGMFVMLGQYFRSSRVRAQMAELAADEAR
ncbi:MAG: hypothetical protein ACKVPX_15465 [Myxococcaceae bacterium]